MTAVNTGLPGIRVPLKSSYASAIPQQTAVFMYSTAGPDGQTVTLQLRETDETIELPASMLSKMSRQTDTATLSISYQDSSEVLTDGTIDLLLATTPLHSTGDGQSTDSPGFELFDSDNGHDLTLSPQTFTANTTADSFLVNDNSNSIGMPVNESDTVGSSEDVKSGDFNKLNMSRRSKPVAKAMSPNRQGPQQCLTCGKVFGNASALAKHKLTHSDERKYVCNVCSKAFKRQDHLNGHMLTHRHKKPFECKANGCGKSYCDARSLRRHTENHHHHRPSSNQGSPPASPSSSTSSGCIQYAPAPMPSPPAPTASATTTSTTTAGTSAASGGGTAQHDTATPSQLQKLLSAEPLSSTVAALPSKNGQTETQNVADSEDSFTKQQFDIIQQIMHHTQQQIATSTASKNVNTKNSSNSKNWNGQQ
ncbi:zinc finger protein 541-like, partial [Sipha flava]